MAKKININKERAGLDEMQKKNGQYKDFTKLENAIAEFGVKFMGLTSQMLMDEEDEGVWEKADINDESRVYENNYIEDTRQAMALFLTLRDKVYTEIIKGDMREIYPADLNHMTSDTVVIAMEMIKEKGMKLTIREKMCVMIGALLHDIERFDSSHMTKREKGEAYDEYKARHQKHSAKIASTLFLKDALEGLEKVIKLTPKEKSLILKIVAGHDIPSKITSREYKTITPQETARINGMVEIVSLADKIAFYTEGMIDAFLQTHTEAQLKEKMRKMYIQLDPENRKILRDLDKGKYEKTFQEAIKDLNI